MVRDAELHSAEECLDALHHEVLDFDRGPLLQQIHGNQQADFAMAVSDLAFQSHEGSLSNPYALTRFYFALQGEFLIRLDQLLDLQQIIGETPRAQIGQDVDEPIRLRA